MREKKKMMRTLLGELEEIHGGDGVFRIAAQNLEGKFWAEKTDEGQQCYRLELEFPPEGVFDFAALVQLLAGWCWLWGDLPDDLREEMRLVLMAFTDRVQRYAEQRQSREEKRANTRPPKLVM